MKAAEVTTASPHVIVRRADIAPFSQRRILGRHTANETLSTVSNVAWRTNNYVPKSTPKLPIISPKKIATRSTLIDITKSSPIKSSIHTQGVYQTLKFEQKRPFVSPENVPKKVLFAEERTSFPTITAEVHNDIKQTLDSSKSTIDVASSLGHSTAHSHISFLHNFTVVWLDSNFTGFSMDSARSTNQFRHVVDIIDPFVDPKACMDFLRKKPNKLIYLIVSSDIARSIIHEIHHMSQIHSIFILCRKVPKQKRWIKKWRKIKGFFTCIDAIYETVQQEIQQYRRDSITVSLTSVDLNRLDSSFMYTQILKEILSEMKYDDTAKKQLTEFCRKYYHDDRSALKKIDKFDQDYNLHTPIWWYTGFPFLYKILNEALRLQKTNIIIKMGFFIRDLHNQIEQLYRPPSEKMILYRGQALSYAHCSQLKMIQNRLYSFNSFLSTSTDRELALMRAESARDTEGSEHRGVLFQITVDPIVHATAPFASLDDVSFFLDKEQEMLFSTHTVFRIGEVKSIGDRLWQVDLLLISNNDDDLSHLTEYIRNVTQGTTGWDRLGKLLLKMDKFEEADEVFTALIENSTTDDMEGLSHRYHLIGQVKRSKCNYNEALFFYNKALQIYQTSSSSNPSDFAVVYNDIGSVHKDKEEYTEALTYFRMALDYQDESNPFYYSNLVNTYSNMAEVHKNMRQYREALDILGKLLNLHKKSSVLYDYQNLATINGKIAEVHFDAAEYLKALRLFKKALNMHKMCLPRPTIDTAAIDNRIGQVFERMGKHDDAFTHYQLSLECYQNALDSLKNQRPLNASELAILYDKIAHVYVNMKNYSDALTSYQKTLDILQRSLQLKQPDLTTIYDNIGQMFEKIGNYEKAQLSYRQAILITRQSPSQNLSRLSLYQQHLSELREKFKRTLSFLNDI